LCINLFNIQFLIEILIIFSLIFIFNSRENFFVILNAVIFLFFITVLAWNEDLDILISFLTIIDLGLFLVLFAYILSTSTLFVVNTEIRSFFKILFSVFFFILNIFYFCLQLNTVSLDISNLYFNFNLIYYNWYNILNLIFFTDLQLLSEIYFSFNLFEFLLMNFYIYVAILIIYYLVNIVNYFFAANFKKTIFNFINFKHTVTGTILKNQNLQKQKSQFIKVRVWSKNNLKKNDSTVNMIKFNR